MENLNCQNNVDSIQERVSKQDFMLRNWFGKCDRSLCLTYSLYNSIKDKQSYLFSLEIYSSYFLFISLINKFKNFRILFSFPSNTFLHFSLMTILNFFNFDKLRFISILNKTNTSYIYLNNSHIKDAQHGFRIWPSISSPQTRRHWVDSCNWFKDMKFTFVFHFIHCRSGLSGNSTWLYKCYKDILKTFYIIMYAIG